MNLRAWIRWLDPASVLVVVAIAGILAAILLAPPVPDTAYPLPPPTVAYGQPGQYPDTLLDDLEGRVYTAERRITELEARIEELERSSR